MRLDRLAIDRTNCSRDRTFVKNWVFHHVSLRISAVSL